MKIVIDDYQKSKDVEVEEFLEPTSTVYQIRQGENVIDLNQYKLEELICALKFISTRHKIKEELDI